MAKIVYDGFGRRIGTVTTLPDGKNHIHDANGQPLGSVGPNGTITTNGKLVSRTPMASLLLNPREKQNK